MKTGESLPKVSVIMTVCNVEEYLRQSVDSVLGQTLRDIEVVCVDDGSTDGSAAILGEYASRDTRVKVLRQENRGAGAARNAGLDVASGEWLAFLDSDDVFDAPMLKEMVEKGEQEKSDVVACTLAERGDIFRRWKGWAWDKIFRRDFIMRTGLRFQEIPVSNDLFFTYAALAMATKIASVPKEYVYHRKRSGSVETMRDLAPMAPLEAVKALYAKVGMIDGFARWVPDFLFWHINRLKSLEASRQLHQATESLGRELGIRSTGKWILEEVKHAVKGVLLKVTAT